MIGKVFPHKQDCKCFRCSGVVWNKGKHYSLKHEGQFKKGQIAWNNGKKGLQIAWNKGLKGYVNNGTFKKGHSVSIGLRNKISISNKTRIPSEKQKRIASEIAKKNKLNLKGLIYQQNMKEPTSIEKKVYDELRKRGLLFEKQYFVNGKFIVDAFIPSLNLIIEADGDYWHGLDRVVKKDKIENAYLKACGYKLLRLSETQINNDSFIEKIKCQIV